MAAAVEKTKAGSDGSQNLSTYFRRTPPLWMLVIGSCLALWAWAIFSPETYPYSYLGPLGTFVKYMVTYHNGLFQIGFYGSWLIHIGEAFYSFQLFKEKGITDPVTQLKWFVQTIFFGFCSFGYLLFYNPKNAKKGK